MSSSIRSSSFVTRSFIARSFAGALLAAASLLTLAPDARADVYSCGGKGTCISDYEGISCTDPAGRDGIYLSDTCTRIGMDGQVESYACFFCTTTADAAVDSGIRDSGIRDSGIRDSGIRDVAIDVYRTDAEADAEIDETQDAEALDAEAPDAEALDAEALDAATRDAATRDGGVVLKQGLAKDENPCGDNGCRTSSAAPNPLVAGASWLLALIVPLIVRRARASKKSR